MARIYKIKYFLVFLFLSLFFLNCKGKKQQSEGMDLMKYGIPYTIKAPTDAKATQTQSGYLTNVNISDGKFYEVQVFMADANTADLKKLKQEHKEILIMHPAFSKIIEEFDNGFIFEKQEDDGTKSYDFYIVKIVGNNEISFIGGNTHYFTEDQVKKMVKSILY